MSSNSMCLIKKIAKLAIQNFHRDQSKKQNIVTASSLDQLRSLLNKITPSDLNINPSLFQDTGPFDPEKDAAPVTYMQIYENDDVTICIFILKTGVRLPLHDHPEMNGFLKVIHGNISIQSYTLDDRDQSLGRSNGRISGIYSAVKHPVQNVTATDSVCFLSPDNHNLHEIKSVDGLAAFLDILSPPYGYDKHTGTERDCHYFREIDSSLANCSFLENDSVFLLHIPTPADFWCDRAEYEGPSLNDIEKKS